MAESLLQGESGKELHEKEIRDRYPLHYNVWYGNVNELDELLLTKLHNHEATDPHGRTPLLLAIALDKKECIDVLLKHKADASAVDKQGWSATQEAVGNGDPELLRKIIQHREHQQMTHKSGGIVEILELLEEADDFYVEMKWEFSSWLPLVSKMCPSDSYKIWKSGAAVRVDTTLLGFQQTNWQRGHKSFIYKGGSRSSDFFEIDHETNSYWRESISVRDETITMESLRPPTSVINSRLTSTNVSTILDHEEISFARQKTFMGLGGDRSENINGYEAKVFSVSGVELVTRTRLEHLTEEDRIKIQEERQEAKSSIPSVLQFLNQSDNEVKMNTVDLVDVHSRNPYDLSLEAYFNLPSGKDVGRLRKMTARTQTFTATVALSDSFPLSLQEQVLPIINLMAHSSTHFAKLRDFITLQLPAGFPIKIEIPLFRVLNARVTFNNLNGAETCPDGVVILTDTAQTSSGAGQDSSSAGKFLPKHKCVIDKSIFNIHNNYRDMGMDTTFHERSGQDAVRDEDDALLQMAIQRSLSESTQPPPENQDEMLQRVFEESLRYNCSEEPTQSLAAIPQQTINETSDVTHDVVNDVSNDVISEEQALAWALEMSRNEQNADVQRQQEEDEELERILALSLQEM